MNNKQCKQVLKETYHDFTTEEVIDKLIENQLVDCTRVQMACMRKRVMELVEKGNKKIDSMYRVADDFCCSYENVRKAVYYYTDVKL